MAKSFLGFLLLSSFLLLPLPKQSFSQPAQDETAEMSSFIDQLIRMEQDISRLKSFSPLQKLTTEKLVVFVSPHTGVVPYTFQRADLKWVTDKEVEKIADWMTSPQWALYDLASQLSPLPKAPLTTAVKKFDPYIPDTSCPALKKKRWYNKWVIYPGDYVCDRHVDCKEMEIAPADLTLLYFSGRKEGKNVYFGLRKEKERWALNSIFREYDRCED